MSSGCSFLPWVPGLSPGQRPGRRGLAWVQSHSTDHSLAVGGLSTVAVRSFLCCAPLRNILLKSHTENVTLLDRKCVFEIETQKRAIEEKTITRMLCARPPGPSPQLCFLRPISASSAASRGAWPICAPSPALSACPVPPGRESSLPPALSVGPGAGLMVTACFQWGRSDLQQPGSGGPCGLTTLKPPVLCLSAPPLRARRPRGCPALRPAVVSDRPAAPVLVTLPWPV